MRLLSSLVAVFLFALPTAAHDRCDASHFGDACGAKLWLDVDYDKVTVYIKDGPKHSHVQLFFGGCLRDKIKIPFSSCYAQIDGLIEVTGVTDAYGNLTGTLKVPPGFKAEVYLQAVILVLKDLRFVATNGGKLDCRS